MSEKESTKEKIVEAAWSLFHKNGYDQTTLDDILEASNTSKGSFYYYFKSKSSLLSTLSDFLDDKYKKIKMEIDPEMNSFEKLMYLNYKMHAIIEEKINYELIGSLYASQIVDKDKKYLLSQDREYYKLVTSIIEEGQNRNQIRKDKKIMDIMKMYSLCERALVTDWCLYKASYSLTEHSIEYMPILFSEFRVK